MTNLLRKKNILYIWITKTAGTSMFHIFQKYSCQKLKYPKDYLNFKNEGFVTFGHISIFSLIRRGIVTKEYFNRVFKFCFVRNPWDRLVSLYAYKKRANIKKFGSFENYVLYIQKKFKWKNFILSKFFNKIFERYLHKYEYFHKKFRKLYYYFEYFLQKINLLNIFEPIGLYNILGISQVNPQVSINKKDELNYCLNGV